MNENRVEIVFTNPLKVEHVMAKPVGGATITIQFERFTIKAKGDVMYTLPVDHTVKMQVAYVDAKGNPATIDGDVAWESSDEAVATVTAQGTGPDSTICHVTPAGTVGQVQITATVDADIGEGVRELITICDIDIVGGEAVTGTIQPVGEPEPLQKVAAKKA